MIPPEAASPMNTPEALACTFAQRACIPRAQLPAGLDDPWAPSLRPAWEAYLAELGVTPSAAFLALLDEAREHRLDFGGWGVLGPEGSRYYQSLFARPQHPLPIDTVYSATVPICGCDGDLLLLDRDGAVYAYLHDGDTEADAPVAPSFEALLCAVLDALDGRAPWPLDLAARAASRGGVLAP